MVTKLYYIFVAYNCTKGDYKLWSPTSSKDHLKTSCVLGQTQIFQRRAPKANCYNGMNYNRPIQTVTCDCDIEDYTWYFNHHIICTIQIENI